MVCDSRRSLDDVSVILLSFEKYYMRNGGYASLTVMLVESEDAQTADIIGSGGGEGFQYQPGCKLRICRNGGTCIIQIWF